MPERDSMQSNSSYDPGLVRDESLVEHLATYGIQRFDDDDYWRWAAEHLGERRAEELDRLREPLIESRASDEDRQALYELIAVEPFASVVHSSKADAIRATGQAVCELLAGRNAVLDVGCGLGYLTTWFAQAEADRSVLGIDRSRATVREATRHVPSSVKDRVRFEVVDIVRSRPAGRFDAVVDAQTLSDLDDPALAIRHVQSVLTDSGIVVSVPAIGTAAGLTRFLASFAAAGLTLSEFAWVAYRDLGERGAYPLLVLDSLRPTFHVDFEAEYNSILATFSRLEQDL
jgi:2-polyprenyl-3-methyl-5-hydroxy-6-metoxy-1,4-benzoquinol methylase